MAASFRDTQPNWNRFSGIFRVLSTSSTNSDTSLQLNPTRNSRINAIKPNPGSFCDGSEADLLSIDSSPAESDENVRMKKETNGFHQPIIVESDLNIMDGGCTSFYVDTVSGKKFMMIDATGMNFAWGGTRTPRPSYWELGPSPDSMFSFTKVAQLIQASWLELSLLIDASLLSPYTSCYLVFKLESNSYGFEHTLFETSVGLSTGKKSTKTIFLAPLHGDPQINFVRQAPSEVSSSNNGTKGQYPKRRADGWLESELGECFVARGGDADEVVEVRMNEIKGGHWKRGLVIQGIEFRPKAVGDRNARCMNKQSNKRKKNARHKYLFTQFVRMTTSGGTTKPDRDFTT